MASLGMAFSIAYFYYNIHTQFRETSFMNKLGKYNGNKDEMANDIDDEYREHTTVVVNKTVHTKLMIGSSWLIKLGRYSASFARIGDADFEVVKFIDNSLTTQDGPVVLIIMKATSKDNLFEEFTFSLPSYAHYQLLATRIRGPIRNPVELHMKKSQVDLFVEAFEKELDKNERYKYSGDPPLELCFGCSEKGANVKINCLCERRPTEMYPGTAECTNCLCKPYWCSSCLAKIFMAKQEQAPTDWLFGKAPCPTCRGIFCILDVSRVVLS
uniref:RING-type domain-containing protein n=1 Tax=Rhabditophanes sp. KR3021 TaxID=114890 RepID=A0AC35TYL2_9BILA